MPAPHAHRDYRRVAFYLVTAGAMSVSIGGQVDTIAPRIGVPLAVVFAVVNDVGAIVALDCAIGAAKGTALARWAWVAAFLAALSGGTLNAWHAILGTPAPPPAPFPWPLGLIVGVEPIVLVLVLSHLLTLARRPATAEREVPAPRPGREVTPVESVESTVAAVVESTPPGRELTAPTPVDRPVRPARERASAPPPRLHSVPPPGPDWMTAELLADVVAAMRANAAESNRPYGEGRIVAEHSAKHSPLPDGSDLGPSKARAVKQHIERHRLLEVAS